MSKLFNHAWKIITVDQPVMVHRTLDEVWLFNPNRRYILNADQVEKIKEYVDTCSDFENSSLHVPLRAGHDLHKATLLVERLRERGIGDLMFLTGPLAFINHISGHSVKSDVYALSDRGVIMTHNPDVRHGTILAGPVEYDNLRNYNYHWFVANVTECDEEPDQLNVYDALYRQLGFNPDQIEPQWKRPKAICVAEDYQHLDRLYAMVFNNQKIHLGRVGYYVVAPFSHASVRSMAYGKWLEIIQALATRRPVVVVGTTKIMLPDTDMCAGKFVKTISQMQGNSGVINAIDGTPLRVMMALISKAKVLIGLDSGPLYLAQALRTPAISLWGSHSPAVRLGYDQDYMDLSIWTSEHCNHAPCFAYANFPQNKCPEGRFQRICDVYNGVTVDSVLQKIDMVESANIPAKI